MLALIAHSSDVMDCCPKFKTLKFPDDPMDFTPDGLPRHAEACFADWKARMVKDPAAHVQDQALRKHQRLATLSGPLALQALVASEGK
jgi:hypothetical protein